MHPSGSLEASSVVWCSAEHETQAIAVGLKFPCQLWDSWLCLFFILLCCQMGMVRLNTESAIKVLGTVKALWRSLTILLPSKHSNHTLELQKSLFLATSNVVLLPQIAFLFQRLEKDAKQPKYQIS